MKVSEATGKISSVTNMIAGFLLFPGVEELDFAGPWGDVSHLSIYANGMQTDLMRTDLQNA